jgi:hypothetical protein
MTITDSSRQPLAVLNRALAGGDASAICRVPTAATIFFGRPTTPETLAGWVTDATAGKRYVEAFARSDFDAML